MASYDVSIVGADSSITRRIQIFAIEAIAAYIGLQATKPGVPRYILFENDKSEETNFFRYLGTDGKTHKLDAVPDSFFVLGFEENSEEDTVMFANQIRSNAKPIYHDSEVETTIAPIYHRYEATLNVQFHTKVSSTQIRYMIERMKQNAARGLRPMCNVTYGYPVGDHIQDLLEEIYKIKQFRYSQGHVRNPKEVGMSFEEYFRYHSDNRLTFSKDKSKKLSPMIRESQMGIILHLNDEPYGIKVEKDDGRKTTYFSVSFRIYYAKPATFQITRPILIFNQRVREDLEVEYYPMYTQDRIRCLASIDAEHFFHINKLIEPVAQILSGRQLFTDPAYDRVYLNTVPSNLLPISTTLIAVDDDSPRSLLHLRDLYEHLTLSESMINFLILERDYVGSRLRSVFYLALVKDGTIDYNNPIILSEEGEMSATYDLSPVHLYRIGLFVNHKLEFFEANDMKRIARHVTEIGEALDPHFEFDRSRFTMDYIFRVFDAKRYRRSESLRLSLHQALYTHPYTIGIINMIVNMTRPLGDNDGQQNQDNP